MRANTDVRSSWSSIPTMGGGLESKISGRGGESMTSERVREPAPEFGQHTEEVLTGLLDYSWEEVGALRERKVI